MRICIQTNLHAASGRYSLRISLRNWRPMSASESSSCFLWASLSFDSLIRFRSLDVLVLSVWSFLFRDIMSSADSGLFSGLVSWWSWGNADVEMGEIVSICWNFRRWIGNFKQCRNSIFCKQFSLVGVFEAALFEVFLTHYVVFMEFFHRLVHQVLSSWCNYPFFFLPESPYSILVNETHLFRRGWLTPTTFPTFQPLTIFSFSTITSRSSRRSLLSWALPLYVVIDIVLYK